MKAASRLLRQTPLASLDYYGFVEGDDIGKGTVDVVVTEGFAGNIALKTAEGNSQADRPIFARGHAPWLAVAARISPSAAGLCEA